MRIKQIFIRYYSFIWLMFVIFQAKANGEELDTIDLKPDHSAEFKTNLGHYEEECYFQPLQEGDILHVIVNVIKGGDLKIDMFVFDHNSVRIDAKFGQTFIWYDNSKIYNAGDYKICLRNNGPEKFVFVNIISFAKSEIQQQKQHKQQLNETQAFLMSALHNVAISIHTMRVTQIQQKIFYSADESLVSELNSYIQVYSVIQSVVIFLVGLIQVIFIKFLFKSSSSSSSSSPSAATYNYYGKN